MRLFQRLRGGEEAPQGTGKERAGPTAWRESHGSVPVPVPMAVPAAVQAAVLAAVPAAVLAAVPHAKPPVMTTMAIVMAPAAVAAFVSAQAVSGAFRSISHAFACFARPVLSLPRFCRRQS